jgi:hypothetical protein
LYSVVDGVASPPAFDFTATNALGTAQEGDELSVSGPTLLHVRSNAPPAFTTIVHRGLSTITAVKDAQDLSVHTSDQPGVYWVEIVSTGQPHPITWLRSNPVYVRGPEVIGSVLPRPAPSISTPILNGQTASRWRTEQSPSSRAVVVAGSSEGAPLEFEYSLAASSPSGQFAGLVYDGPPQGPFDRVRFTARADRAMRISVQFRSSSGARWQRSVYLDVFDAERTVFLDDVTPISGASSPRPPLADIASILFVVDTTNTKPGASGHVWIRDVALEK